MSNSSDVSEKKVKIRTDAFGFAVYILGIELIFLECYGLMKFLEFLEC